MPNVHKDFHGALSYGLQFLEDSYGREGMNAFLERLAGAVYGPLCDSLRERGLDALREHLTTVFDVEEGAYETEMDGDTLVFRVTRCPAVTHMREHCYRVADHFCEHTRIVNEAICAAAGYASSVDYDQAAGTCVQRFWRKQA